MRREKERKMRCIKEENKEKRKRWREWMGDERRENRETEGGNKKRKERWREVMGERRDVRNERYGGREQEGEGECGRDIGRGEWPRNGSQLSESLSVCVRGR